jgi:cytochrome c-type biogenesis protein CcmE
MYKTAFYSIRFTMSKGSSMAQSTTSWEKPPQSADTPRAQLHNTLGRLPFLLGGVLLLAAVGYLIFNATQSNAQFYITVDQLLSGNYANNNVRISGVVIGDTIRYDAQNLVIEFEIANLPDGYADLAEALHQAANNPDAQRIRIRVEGQVKPDLLRHEAQAILSGRLGADGVFLATELLLKCPTRMTDLQLQAESTAEAPSTTGG